MAEDKKQVMTTDAGRPVGHNQNSLTVGPRGPIVFEDYLLFEKMAHFNFYKADVAYGGGVAKGLGLDISAIVAKRQATAAD